MFDSTVRVRANDDQSSATRHATTLMTCPVFGKGRGRLPAEPVPIPDPEVFSAWQEYSVRLAAKPRSSASPMSPASLVTNNCD